MRREAEGEKGTRVSKNKCLSEVKVRIGRTLGIARWREKRKEFFMLGYRDMRDSTGVYKELKKKTRKDN